MCYKNYLGNVVIKLLLLFLKMFIKFYIMLFFKSFGKFLLKDIYLDSIVFFWEKVDENVDYY